VLRINRNIDKRCKCVKKTFVVDLNNRAIHCGSCGAWTDPFDAIYYLAPHLEGLLEQVKSLLEQRRQIVNYKPHMVVFRELERR
jgi:hypothetical protein